MSDYASKIDALDTLDQGEWSDGYAACLSAASEIASAADAEIAALTFERDALREALQAIFRDHYSAPIDAPVYSHGDALGELSYFESAANSMKHKARAALAEKE